MQEIHPQGFPVDYWKSLRVPNLVPITPDEITYEYVLNEDPKYADDEAFLFDDEEEEDCIL